MNQSPNIRRREFVGMIAVMLGGTLSSACTRMLLNDEQVARSSDAAAPLAASQRVLVEVASELILTKTDTPGANEVGVPDFIERMLSEWYEPEERDAFLAGLDDLDRRSREAADVVFVDASPEIQTAILAELEAGTSERLGAPLLLRRQSPETFYLALKELTVVGYCTSEVGATQVFQWQSMPGIWDGCAPLASLGRASIGW